MQLLLELGFDLIHVRGGIQKVFGLSYKFIDLCINILIFTHWIKLIVLVLSLLKYIIVHFIRLGKYLLIVNYYY